MLKSKINNAIDYDVTITQHFDKINENMSFDFRSSNDNKHMFHTRLSFITMCFPTPIEATSMNINYQPCPMINQTTTEKKT